jgi:hypothetical protein
MMLPPDGKPGQMLVHRGDGAWEWVTPSAATAPERRFVALVVVVVVTMLLASGLLLVCARAQDAPLPGGVTCEQIVRYAEDLRIPNTWRGRAQAKVIALALGIVVTDAQLDAAARCLRSAQVGDK